MMHERVFTIFLSVNKLEGNISAFFGDACESAEKDLQRELQKRTLLESEPVSDRQTTGRRNAISEGLQTAISIQFLNHYYIEAEVRKHLVVPSARHMNNIP